ncbi:DUF6134 family protein [Spirosoma sp. KNUC1025]|uniref:DUF6134 family protein n=1 Tax=Spirosoma sp. KNUC1025 TaxID=2894082 RepID=UPI00386B61F5|nr:hypothetical protein LN737_19590 [Spirosoma sp. KNUC1025]
MLLGKWLGIGLIQMLLTQPSFHPTLLYDVIVNNHTVGVMQVTALPTATGLQYRVDADVRLQLLGERRMITRFTSTYQDKLLTEARFHDQLNGKTRHDALVRWDGMAYRILVNGAHSELNNRRVTYSTASLYLQEPLGIRELFSERHGQFCPLRPVASHVYEMTLPDGRKNRYRYVEGVCQEVEVQQVLFTIYFRLRHN